MIPTVKISHLVCIIGMLIAAPRLSVARREPRLQEQLARGMASFGTGLLVELDKDNANKSIAFSPFSIETCLTMARMGATGETALEMDRILTFSTYDTEDLAEDYHAILEQYQNNPAIKIANKMYVDEGFIVQDEFDNRLTSKLYSSVDYLNFNENVESAHIINTWVEEQTNNLIKNLVDPSILTENTRLMLVNAIHFKANWKYPFNKEITAPSQFYLSDNRKTDVQMMIKKRNFLYGNITYLEAEAFELPYEDDDLSMLVILPYKADGLKQLQYKLTRTYYDYITQRMSSTEIRLKMPKFKTEFSAQLEQPLKRMGFERMFSAPEFDNMLKTHENLAVSSIVHKAFIEVNESGTEAAAATEYGAATLMFVEIIQVVVDHPFFYAIRSKKTGVVLFEGVQTFA